MIAFSYFTITETDNNVSKFSILSRKVELKTEGGRQ